MRLARGLSFGHRTRANANLRCDRLKKRASGRIEDHGRCAAIAEKILQLRARCAQRQWDGNATCTPNAPQGHDPWNSGRQKKCHASLAQVVALSQQRSRQARGHIQQLVVGYGFLRGDSGDSFAVALSAINNE